MARTVIDLDDEAFEAARQELGTKTKVETVNAALREIAARRTRVASYKRLTEALDRSDLDDPEVMRGAWR